MKLNKIKLTFYLNFKRKKITVIFSNDSQLNELLIELNSGEVPFINLGDIVIRKSEIMFYEINKNY